MRRAERLDTLLRRLGDRPGITAAELGRDLGVSPRGVFRDLAYLRTRGYPIESSRGRGGGLRLHPQWGLGKVLLAPEEALGALLSLAIAEQLSLPMFALDAGRARRKIVDALPGSMRRQLGPLRERILVGRPASQRVRESYRNPDATPARNLQIAFVRAHAVTVEYIKEGGERIRRLVEPHALLLNWPAWYLLGHDHQRAEARTFRLDRFVLVRDSGTAFRPRPRAVVAAVGGLDSPSHERWSL